MSSFIERVSTTLGSAQNRMSVLAAVTERQQILAELGRLDVECQMARDQGRLGQARTAYQRLRTLEQRLESA